MKHFIQLTLILLPFVSSAQLDELTVRKMCNDAPEPQLVMECSRMIQENQFFLAEIVADKLLTLQPNSPNYNYRKGFLILKSRYDYEAATPFFRMAVTNTDKNYDAFSHKEQSAPIDAFYHMACCHHLAGEFDLAEEQFKNFTELSSKKSELIEMSNLHLQQVAVARELVANPKSAIVKNVGPAVNTDMPEYSPVISLDGTSLYFTSRRQWENFSSDGFRDPMLNQYPEDIFVSYQDFDGNWINPVKLEFCDNKMNEATIAVSSDERRVYVYEDITGNGDIYYSNFSGNKFEDLKILDHQNVNTEFWETHCTTTPDGQHFYFVSDRPGGYGGRDIYRIVKLPNGEWSQPQNMGPTINTPYDEEAPYINVNNKTLYFASNGPKSMGGFDIFVSFRDENNNWSDPMNMGYPINSTGDDIFYTTTVDGLRGYLTSFRSGGYGEKDIYEIQNDYMGHRSISSLRGIFRDIHGDPIPEDLSVKLICENCEFEANKSQDLRIKRATFFSVLERCKDYRVEYFDGSGTLLGSERFVTKCTAENEEINVEHFLGDYRLTVYVADAKTFQPIDKVQVEMIDPETKENLMSYNTDTEGMVYSDILSSKNYGDRVKLRVHLLKEGYLAQTFEVDTVLKDIGLIELEYLLHQKEVGTDIGALFDLNPIYFDLNKSNIRPDAAIELDKIVDIMNENPTLKIELGSHTDCRASKSYNKLLSDRRAKSSAAYIRSRITTPSRIYGKGYGESQLVNDCECEGDVVSDCTEEEHQANRRTEFRVVK